MSSLKTLETLKKIKPYFVVVHMGSGQSAVYNRKYEKMFEGASSRLLNYATQYSTQVSVGFRLTLPEQQPSWMLPELSPFEGIEGPFAAPNYVDSLVRSRPVSLTTKP